MIVGTGESVAVGSAVAVGARVLVGAGLGGLWGAVAMIGLFACHAVWVGHKNDQYGVAVFRLWRARAVGVLQAAQATITSQESVGKDLIWVSTSASESYLRRIGRPGDYESARMPNPVGPLERKAGERIICTSCWSSGQSQTR